jgi:pantoate--beta-alanine ligase
VSAGDGSTLAIVDAPDAMSAWSASTRSAGLRMALVPTMGALHEGHLALVREACRRAERVVVSLFVNPTQFAPGEDLGRYPRDFDGDRAKVEAAGAHVLFAPTVDTMYAPGAQTFVEVVGVSQGLCGARRPGHFRGVATVVLKLFNIVTPHVAVFGEKDYQQLMVVRRMVADLDLPIEVVGLPTVREPDGLAMSSRNRYLSAPDRSRAGALHRGLSTARTMVAAGERRTDRLMAVALAEIEPEVDRVDYLEVRDAETLAPVAVVERPAVMLVAAFVGTTRLIDNLKIAPR